MYGQYEASEDRRADRSPHFLPGAPPHRLNGCRACGADFSSVETFDAHRVGKHEYLLSPERVDGRRCLDEDEMTAKGWRKDKRGRWVNPARAERARQAFQEVA